MAKSKYKGLLPSDPLQAVLQELEATLARSEADPAYRDEKDMFRIGYHAGYIDGLKRAINIVNYEIGIRQSPPNINYPGEKPQ
jgi:hypothetical protein